MSSAPVAALVIVLTLTAVLVISGVAKLRDPRATRDAFDALRVPHVVAPDVSAKALPWVEIVLAVLLVAAPGGWLAPVAAVLLVLMLTYTWLVARALGFDEPVSCSCFGSLGRHEIDRTTLGRNVLLTALAAVVTWWALDGGSTPCGGDGARRRWLVGAGRRGSSGRGRSAGGGRRVGPSVDAGGRCRAPRLRAPAHPLRRPDPAGRPHGDACRAGDQSGPSARGAQPRAAGPASGPRRSSTAGRRGWRRRSASWRSTRTPRRPGKGSGTRASSRPPSRSSTCDVSFPWGRLRPSCSELTASSPAGRWPGRTTSSQFVEDVLLALHDEPSAAL